MQLLSSTASQPIFGSPSWAGQAEPTLQTSRTAAPVAAQLTPKQFCNTLGSDKALKNPAQPRQLTHCLPGPELSPALYCKPMSARTHCWRSHLPSLGSGLSSHSQEDSAETLCPALGRQKLPNRSSELLWSRFARVFRKLDMKRGGSGSSDSIPERGIFLLSPSNLPNNSVYLVCMARC